MSRPVPSKLARDLAAAPICRNLRRGHDVGYHRDAFVARPRYERGTVEHAHDLHVRGLVKRK